MDKKTILVVEDNKDMQVLYKDMIDGSYNLVVAGNTEDAMKHLKKDNVSLMILDIVLPKQRGDDFFLSLKKNPKFRGLKAICISVLDDVREKMRTVDPTVEFLSKPFRKEELIGLVNRMLTD